MLFALFTLGYFLGVFTALMIFSPKVKEIEEQEKDALAPILGLGRQSPDGEEKVSSSPVGLVN